MTGFLGGWMKTPPTIIEIEKDSKLPEMNGDLRESIRTLEYHPGYNYLIQRLRHAKSVMNAQLREGMELTETQLRYLQAGIFWAGWLENEQLSLTKKVTQRPQSLGEAEEFEKLQGSLDLIGIPPK